MDPRTMKSFKKTKYAKAFIEELLLYSGQFGLFYIVMQFIIEGAAFFRNAGHVGLFISLLIQTSILSMRGNIPKYRMALSLIVPVVYSGIELVEGSNYTFNAAHIGFWIYAIFSSFLMTIKQKRNESISRLAEILLVVINILIFIFIYFYFDTWKEVQSNEQLTIFNIIKFIPIFFEDPTHWFIIAGGALLATTVALGRYEISKLKDKILILFGRYVDQNVRDRIIENGNMASRKLNLCVLFSDIKEFTSLCENNDPGSVTDMLNVYFEEWDSIVNKHNGTIDKFIGDAIMVIFGLDDSENSCDSAIQCCIEIENNYASLVEKLRLKELPIPSGYGIGCHYGELIVGDIGSPNRRNFTAIGDTVNVASRLESATRTTESNIIISSKVYDKIDSQHRKRFRNIGMLDLKGKRENVEAWGIIKGQF